MIHATFRVLLLLLLLLHSLILQADCQLPPRSDFPLEIQSYLEQFTKGQQFYEFLDHPVLSASIPTAFSASVGERCRNDSYIYAQRILDPRHPWATQSKLLLRFFTMMQLAC